MKPAWWTGLGLALLGIGVVAILGTAYIAAEPLGPLMWLLCGAALFVMGGAVLLIWQRPRAGETGLRGAGLALMEAALEERAERIGRRHRELTRRLTQLHEWTEFPGGDPPRPAGEGVLALAEDLGEKDRAVAALLEKRTEILFEKVKNNAYQTDGIFQRERLAEDLIGLVESVARIYNPGSRQPLLETSVENLLRAASRISLQLLFLLEGLPLDIKSYNLQTSYEMIRKGARAYGVYKSAAPYLSYVRPFYYLGRYAVGAAPVTLGAGWAVSGLVTSGARRFSKTMANRYALSLLRDMVLIVGGEAAGVFGGDYRHRDPNWIYGAELTALVAACPLSPEILRSALEEVNRLVLRNEYDRLFLYRCLASGTSAKPERFADAGHLPLQEREMICRRLERFDRRHVRKAAVSPEDLSRWRKPAERRLGVKIKVGTTQEAAGPPAEKSEDGLLSLAGFLAEVKGCDDPDQWPEKLSQTRLFRSLDSIEREAFLRELLAAPPMIFDYPDLASDDRRVDDYLSDLVSLTVRGHPRNDAIDAVVEEAARYFRKTETAVIKKRLDRAYVDELSASLHQDSPVKRPSPEVARPLVQLLMEGESARFLYRSVSLKTDQGHGDPLPFPHYAEPWLMGTDQRVVLVAVNRKFRGVPILVWSGSKPGGDSEAAEISRVPGRFRDICRITGGTWHWDRVAVTPPFPAIQIAGPAMGRYEDHFRPLTQFFRTVD